MEKTIRDAILPVYAPADLVFERGEGAYLITQDGARYLDFASGIAVTALGHAHPHLVAALREQAGKLWHTSNAFRIAGQERLAERLTAACFADRVFFTNSGTEAIECAVKVMRAYQTAKGAPERFHAVVFDGAFHGRTLAALSAGCQAKGNHQFGPPVQGFDHVPFGDLAAAAAAAIGPQTGAILVEPVQGEGGVKPATPEFMAGLRKLCDEHGMLLMLDEVQCGMGRTGRLFAYEWSGITPDIVATAKGLGGGFPVGACLATEKAASGMVVGMHGSTFGGNPLAMAVGNAVLDILLEDGFLDRVNRMAQTFRVMLEGLAAQFPAEIEEVRGLGLLCGLKMRVDNKAMVAALRDEGLLAVGASDNVVRLIPPLIVEEAQLSEAADKIAQACNALKERP